MLDRLRPRVRVGHQGRPARSRPRTRTHAGWVVAAALVVPLLGTQWVGLDGMGWALAAVGIWLAVIVTAVVVMRVQRKHYDAEVAAWAGEQARQEERLRVAADLHDIVSHGLGLITVRAAAALRMPGPGGDAERDAALADIERVSRDTTVELRRMLGVLRTTDAAPLRPAETLGDLPGIARSARAAGLAVELTIDDVGKVSLGVQQAVCAVVREALHNVLRHAGPTMARVAVSRQAAARDSLLVVEVSDDGPAPGWASQPGAGHGLDGMRMRVAALGGTCDAGRAAGPAGTGFRVIARFPDGEGR